MKHNGCMTLTDESLEQRLSAMTQEGIRDASQEEELPAPPIVNLYRLEREAERRRDDRALKLTAAAAVISVLLMTLTVTAAAVWTTAHGEEIRRLPTVARMLGFWQDYGRELTAGLTAAAAMTLLGSLVCAVLLIKHRDMLPFLRDNRREAWLV